MSELICVGSIAGAFGVRGELRVKSFCANPLILQNILRCLLKTENKAMSYHLSVKLKMDFRHGL